MILTSTAAIGFAMSSELVSRIEELQILKRILLMLRGEIKYGNATLGEAFASIGRRMKTPYQEFLTGTAKELDMLSGESFKKIWEKMREIHLKQTSLTQKDLARLMSFGEQLGYLDKEMQLSTIELYLEQLEEEIGQAQSNLKKNGRLYKSLGIMCGILICILII